MTSISQDRAVVRRLRRGVVAASHIASLSVGLERQTVEIQKQLRLLRSGSAQACFIEGEWGTGKSHLLTLIGQLSINEGTAVAYLNLNGQNAAINHPQRFYHLIAARVKIAQSASGMSELIQHIYNNQLLRAKLVQWAMINDRTSELAWAIRHLVSGKSVGDSVAFSIAVGSDLSWADYGYKKEKAIKRIADLGHCLWYCGLLGLVLELDELETLDQLWNSRSRKGAYEVLGRLIQMKHVLPVFAVTARFRLLVDQDFVSVPDLGASASEFMNGWRRRQYTLLRSSDFSEESALTLAGRVDDLYSQAYGTSTLRGTLPQVVSDWSRMPTRSPRTLVRRVIHHLDVARNGI
jgi:hypothetical protein